MCALYFLFDSTKAHAFDEFSAAFTVLKDEFLSKIQAIEVSEFFENDKNRFLLRCREDIEFQPCFEWNMRIGSSHSNSFRWQPNNGFPDFDSVANFLEENPQYEIRDWDMTPISLEDFKSIAGLKEN